MLHTPLIDSHAHLTFDDAFGADREAVIARAKAAGVACVLVIGTGLVSSRAALALADAHPGYIYASAGIHPHAVDDFADDDWPALHTLLADPRIRAVGETGLDDFYDLGDRRRQGELFSGHLEAAARFKKPVVVHIRDAFDEAFARTAEVGLAGGGVVHCFTGGVAECARAVALGYHISLSGMVTFKTATALREAVPHIPRDRLLVETDSPYLAPVPHRGKRNEPAFVVDTARQVAALRGESLEKLAAYTTENARRLFNLPG